MHLVFQLSVPPHQSFHHFDSVQLPEHVHLVLQLLDQLPGAAPNVLLCYPVVLSFLIALLLREVTDAPGAYMIRVNNGRVMRKQDTANSPFPFPVDDLGGSL